MEWVEWLEWLLVNFTLLFRGEFPEGMFFLNQEQNFRPGNRHWNDLRASLVEQGIAEKTPLPEPTQEDITNEKGVLKMFYNWFLRKNVETLPVRPIYAVNPSTFEEEMDENNSSFHRLVREALKRYKIVYEEAKISHQAEFDKGQLRIIGDHLFTLEERVRQTNTAHADVPLLEYCAKLGGQWFPFPYGHTIFSRDPYGYAKFCAEINDHVKAVGRGDLHVHTAGILDLQEQNKSLQEQLSELRSQISSVRSDNKQQISILQQKSESLEQESIKLKEDVESVKSGRTNSISLVRSTIFYHSQDLGGRNESHLNSADDHANDLVASPAINALAASQSIN